MSIAIIIPDSWEPAELVRWSSTLARSKDEHLVIIRAKRVANRRRRRKTLMDVATDNTPLIAAIREHAGDFAAADHNDSMFHGGGKARIRRADPVPRCVFLIELDHSELVAGVLKEVKALRVVLLIVPRRQGVRISEEECAVERQLFAEVPCEILQLRPGKSFTNVRDPILVATDGKQQTSKVLKLGAALSAAEDGQVTAVYVRQDVGPSPRKKRQRGVERGVRGLPRGDTVPKTADVATVAEIAGDAPCCAETTGHDMLIVAAGDHLTEDRRIRACVPEKLIAEVDESTIVVVRSALPLRGRLIRSIENRTKSWVPQLDRPGRIEVVRRLQSTADWDFDFLILIFLATLLAALGLVVNSGPVVIGAMVVAPLMAPMLGIGMSVVQGNRRMADKCLGTVGRGFLLAFATGCAVGIIRMIFASGITEEMSNRGAPNVLDLAIAFVSGMVAAYAFGRPHLLSVLPGIAIASSLVPPVAASGLSLIALDFDVAVGAMLLFLSNFVAIVLGASFSLWVVGMRGPHEVNPFTEWAQRWMLAFFAIAVCLAVFFTFKGDGSQIRAALVAMEDNPLASSQVESPPAKPPQADPPTETLEPDAPRSSAPPPDDSAKQPGDAADSRVRVSRKPVAGAASQDAGQDNAQQGSKQSTNDSGKSPSPSVTVVIPGESRGEGANTSVQIEGLPSEDVAELLDGVLNDEAEPNRSQPATLVVIAVGLVGLGYLAWRYRARP